MAAEWWWFLALNAMVAAIAVLSKVGPPSSPRVGGITRRASSAVLQRLRSSIFSFPSAGFHTEPEPLLQPAVTATTVSQETEEPPPAEAASPAKPAASTPRSLTRTPPPARLPSAKEVEMVEEDDDPNAMSMEEAYALVQAAQRRSESERGKEAEEKDDDPNAMSMEEAYALVQEARRWRPEPEREKEAEHEDDDPNAMSMEEAYALVQEARRWRPEPEREKEASDVDAKAEEFIQGFKEDLRQQRLNSIFNYTQMLKQRAQGGRRQPAARPDQL